MHTLPKSAISARRTPSGESVAVAEVSPLRLHFSANLVLAGGGRLAIHQLVRSVEVSSVGRLVLHFDVAHWTVPAIAYVPSVSRPPIVAAEVHGESEPALVLDGTLAGRPFLTIVVEWLLVLGQPTATRPS